MIDPKSFINQSEPDEYISISGNFFCEKCGQRTTSAKMNLDTKTIIWMCRCGENEASI
jgi:lysyl-tRNA synthetase class I